MYFVYILKSIKNGKSYVGSTSKNVGTRLEEHNVGSNIWTRHNGSFQLKYYESFLCKEDALKREKFYKTGIGKRLKKLIINHY